MEGDFFRLGVNRKNFPCPRAFRREIFGFVPCIRFQIDQSCDNFSMGFKTFLFLNFLSCHNYGFDCFWQVLHSKFQICGKPVNWNKIRFFPASEFYSRKSPKVPWLLHIDFQIIFPRDYCLDFFQRRFNRKVPGRRGLFIWENHLFCSLNQNCDSPKLPEDAFALDLYRHAKPSLTATTRFISYTNSKVKEIRIWKILVVLTILPIPCSWLLIVRECQEVFLIKVSQPVLPITTNMMSPLKVSI